MTGADHLVSALVAGGVEIAFGLPGFHSNPIYDALARDERLRHILVRHEQSAGFAADGYARASGKLATAIATAGPGATNLLTPLGEAYSDAIPLLAVTAEVDPEQAGKGAYHELDKLGMFGPVTKWNRRAGSPEQIPALIAEAIACAKAGRPGPVHLEVPEPVLRQEWMGTPVGVAATPPAPTPSASAIDSAVELLASAKRPLIVAGGGVVSGGASDALRELAETLGAPVAETIMGRGSLSSRHPLSVGFCRCPVGHTVREQCDATLAVGSRFSEVTTNGWSVDFPRPLIHVDIDPRAFEGHYPADAPIPGDARLVLDALLDPLRGRREAADGAAVVSAAREEHAQSGRTDERSEFVARLREAVPDETVFVADVLSLWERLFSRLPVYEPRTFLSPALFIAMGWALPAAIGAQLAAPDRPVVAIMGDGGFFITGVELATAADHRLPLVVLLVNNGELGVIRRMQEDSFGGRSHEVRYPRRHDFRRFAESLGATAERVESLTAGAGAVGRVLRAAPDGPHVVEVDLC